jgi:hypothetical protein
MTAEIRRKRVGETGEWEFECSGCETWYEKSKFRGCKKYTDPYGNCLLCSSCRAKKTRTTQKSSDEISAQHILKMIGFYEYPSAQDWYIAKLKENNREKPKRKYPPKKPKS